MNYFIKNIPKVAVAFLLVLPAASHAAPELILTWKASSYTPLNYIGKALPIAGATINASVILVDGGKVVSLTPYDVNWYAGEDRITGGKGIVSARTTTPITGQDTLELRVNVAKYKDQPLDVFATVPIVHPEIIIIKKPNAERQNFSVIPYFWNSMTPDDIAITWNDNGASVTARAVNKKNELEFAQMTILKQ